MLLKVQNNFVVWENYSPKLLRPRRPKKSLLQSLFPPFLKFKSGMKHDQSKELMQVQYGLCPKSDWDKDHQDLANSYCAAVLCEGFYFIPEDLLKEAMKWAKLRYSPQHWELGIVDILRRELLILFGKNPDSDWEKILRIGLDSLSNGRKDHPKLLEALENLKQTDKDKLVKS